MPDELWTEVRDIVQETGIKTIPSKKKCKKAKEFQKNIYFCFLDYAKAFDCVGHKKLWKILQEMGIPDTWPASWEICMKVRKQQLEQDTE